MGARLLGRTALDWDFLGRFPELFGSAVRAEPPAPPEPSRIPRSVAWEAAQWMGDVLGKIRKILSAEHENALFVQRRLDAWAEGARELGIRLGFYSKRLEEVEHDKRTVDRRLTLAVAWQEELRRQALSVEAAARGVQEAAQASAERRELLRQLIELQAQTNAAATKAKKKRKTLLGGRKKLKFKPLA